MYAPGLHSHRRTGMHRLLIGTKFTTITFLVQITYRHAAIGAELTTNTFLLQLTFRRAPIGTKFTDTLREACTYLWTT